MSKRLIWRRLAAVALAAAVLSGLTGCFGALDEPDPPTAEDLEMPTMNETAALNISAASGSDPAAGAAYGMVFSANILQLLAMSYVEIALTGWDESQPTEYTDPSGLYSITWTQDGNTWSWTFVYSVGETTYTLVITVTAVQDGWSVVVTQDGVTFIEATLSTDGSTGQVTLIAPDSGEQFVAEWGPSSVAGYDQHYVVSYYGTTNALEEQLVVDHTADGTSGAWTYTDYTEPTGANDGSGTWG
jgi:YD repeat-containing protein